MINGDLVSLIPEWAVTAGVESADFRGREIYSVVAYGPRGERHVLNGYSSRLLALTTAKDVRQHIASR